MEPFYARGKYPCLRLLFDHPFCLADNHQNQNGYKHHVGPLSCHLVLNPRLLFWKVLSNRFQKSIQPRLRKSSSCEVLCLVIRSFSGLELWRLWNRWNCFGWSQHPLWLDHRGCPKRVAMLVGLCALFDIYCFHPVYQLTNVNPKDHSYMTPAC